MTYWIRSVHERWLLYICAYICHFNIYSSTVSLVSRTKAESFLLQLPNLSCISETLREVGGRRCEFASMNREMLLWYLCMHVDIASIWGILASTVTLGFSDFCMYCVRRLWFLFVQWIFLEVMMHVQFCSAGPINPSHFTTTLVHCWCLVLEVWFCLS